MAFLAAWYLPMGYMAAGTLQIGVLSVIFLQISVNLIVAGSANVIGRLFSILKNIFGAMRRMACETLSVRLTGNMRIMAVKAGRQDAMLIRMTTGATDPNVMFAGMGVHLLSFIGVTYRTGYNILTRFIFNILLHAGERNVQRSVRIPMTLITAGKTANTLL